MYKELRRQDRRMDRAEAEELLKQVDYGFLATAGPDGQPYVVPLNHAYVDGYIVFHCAGQGLKLDNIRQNPKVSYAVCSEHEVQPEQHTTRYRSAIAFGRAEIVEDFALKKGLLVALASRLAPGVQFMCDDEYVARTGVVRVKVEHLTGKKRE
jgi:nitroimidazol reductase NimA-like FMN-containing flavoprotein (pyridoxamine 5'-phosphate oxidase superfamily)